MLLEDKSFTLQSLDFIFMALDVSTIEVVQLLIIKYLKGIFSRHFESKKCLKDIGYFENAASINL